MREAHIDNLNLNSEAPPASAETLLDVKGKDEDYALNVMQSIDIKGKIK